MFIIRFIQFTDAKLRRDSGKNLENRKISCFADGTFLPAGRHKRPG